MIAPNKRSVDEHRLTFISGWRTKQTALNGRHASTVLSGSSALVLGSHRRLKDRRVAFARAVSRIKLAVRNRREPHVPTTGSPTQHVTSRGRKHVIPLTEYSSLTSYSSSICGWPKSPARRTRAVADRGPTCAYRTCDRVHRHAKQQIGGYTYGQDQVTVALPRPRSGSTSEGGRCARVGASDGGAGRTSPCSAVGACWASIGGSAVSLGFPGVCAGHQKLSAGRSSVPRRPLWTHKVR